MGTNSAVGRIVRTGVIGVIAAVVAQGAGAPGACGQQPGQMGRMVPPRAIQQGEDPGPIVSVEFPGGTVREYVRAVQAGAEKGGEPAPVNVLVPAEAAEVVVPPVSLKGVTVRTALDALTYAFPFGFGVEHSFSVQSFGQGPDAANAFAVIYQRGQTPQLGAPIGMAPSGPIYGRQVSSKGVKVFRLSEIVDPPAPAEGAEPAGVPVDVVLTAVEAALGLAGEEGNAVEVKFHPDSGLLIVRGPSEQLALVESLLSEMRDDVRLRWANARQEAAREADRRFRQKRAEVEMGLAEREVSAQAKRVERLRQQVESGQASPSLVEEAEIGLAKKQAQLELLRLEEDRPVADAQERSQVRSVSPARSGDGMDASVMAQLIVDLQRRVTELQSEVDRLRSPKGQR